MSHAIPFERLNTQQIAENTAQKRIVRTIIPIV